MSIDQQGVAVGAPGALARLPRPLLRQLVLCVPVAIVLVIQAVAGELGGLGPFYVGGLALLAALTAVTAVNLRGIRLPSALLAIIPVLDLAAIGAMGLVPDGNGVTVLALLPATWMASDHRMRGAAATAVAVPLLVALPGLVYFGWSAGTVSRAVVLSAIAIACAMTIAGTTDVWRRQNVELESQQDRLTELVSQMRANRALNDAVVSTVDVGLLTLDRDGRFSYTNPRMQEFLALVYPEGRPDRVGRTGEVYAADGRTPLTEESSPAHRAMVAGGFTDHVVWVGPPGDTQRALSVSATPLLDANGERDGAVLAYHDITDLMAALRVKDEFVAAVSHELRTPLTSILGYLEVAEDDPSVSPAVRQQLSVVARNAERLLHLVGDLLLSARVDAGELVLAAEKVDLGAVVAAAVDEQRPCAEDNGVGLLQELPDRLVVTADGSRIAQVVENLVSNAVKYTPAGGEVRVVLAEQSGEVTLSVHDTGMGIAPEDRERVFTRFFRTAEAQRQAIQGLGLGLAITRAIVDAHGGRIEVESEVGRGSTFRVTLPHAPATLASHGGSSDAASRPPAARPGPAVRRLPPA